MCVDLYQSVVFMILVDYCMTFGSEDLMKCILLGAALPQL